MTNNDSDIHRDPEVVAKQLTGKARRHLVRVSSNATDSPIERPKNFKSFKIKDNGSVV